VTGVVQAVSAVPRPGSVVYKDHIFAIHLADLQGVGGPVADTQTLVYMWSMRDSRLTSSARCRPGDKLTLRLRPWSEVKAKYDAVNRSELDDEELNLQEPNWAEAVDK